MKIIYLLSIVFLFSCTSNLNVKNVDPVGNNVVFLDNLLNLKKLENVAPEISKFPGKVSIKKINDVNIYSFKKENSEHSYLILSIAKKGKLLSALYYPEFNINLLEMDIKEKIKTDDWSVETINVGKDDRTEKVRVYSKKEGISFGYYKGLRSIHYLSLKPIQESGATTDHFLY